MKPAPIDQDHLFRLKNLLQEEYQLTGTEWNLIEGCFENIAVKRNAYFLKKGDVCRYLGFISKGVMRFSMLGKEGEEITCFFIQDGDFVGDPDSFMPHKPSDKTIQALTDCELVCFDLPNLKNIQTVFPRFKEIQVAIDKKVMMGLLTQREIFFNLDAKARYLKFIERYPQIL